MTRLAYIWVFLNIVFAIWFYSHENSVRHEAISEATKTGLRLGVMAGCKENNKIRLQVARAAEALHPEAKADDVKANLKPQNCRQEGQKIVRVYKKRAGKD